MDYSMLRVRATYLCGAVMAVVVLINNGFFDHEGPLMPAATLTQPAIAAVDTTPATSKFEMEISWDRAKRIQSGQDDRLDPTWCMGALGEEGLGDASPCATARDYANYSLLFVALGIVVATLNYNAAAHNMFHIAGILLIFTWQQARMMGAARVDTLTDGEMEDHYTIVIIVAVTMGLTLAARVYALMMGGPEKQGADYSKVGFN